MAVSAFGNKSTEPTRQALDDVLSNNAGFLNEIELYLLEQCGGFRPEWKFYGKQAGWTLAYEYAGRRVFHLIPQAGFFIIVFVLGKRAVSACRESPLPEAVKESIGSAREYVEGRSIRVEIRSQEDVASAKQLIAIKLAN